MNLHLSSTVSGKLQNGATRANAVQESRVLMLSEKARGDANPILINR